MSPAGPGGGAGGGASTRALVARIAALGPEARRAVFETLELPASVDALLDAAAAEVPAAVALDFFEDGVRLSYGDLVARVNRTARALEDWGVAAGSHVAVMLPNIPEFPVTWLALARLGAVMVPVNIRYTARELDYVLRDSAAQFLIVAAGSVEVAAPVLAAPDCPVAAGQVVVVGGPTGGFRDWAGLHGDAADTPRPGWAGRAGPDSLMNIQYTSGTTGFPKGCMLTHRYWLTSAHVNGLRDGQVFERVLAPTPFFYLDPQWLMLVAFIHRGTLFVARRQSATRFAGWLRAHRIHFCLFPEIAFKQPPHPEDAATELRRANVYGIRKEIHAELRRRFNAPAMEAFGMTEVGPGLYMPLEHEQMVGSGSCGIAAPLREARVVDGAGREVPPGVEGELAIRGPGIFRGYWNRPDATAEAFFGEWFRTGDIFRRDAEGYFTIVGRTKDMVRRAGENIAAREVEAVMRNLPEIEDAAVLGVPDPLRGEEVMACLLPAATPDADLLERAMRHAGAELASFKVPRYWVWMTDLPRTPSGKIAKGVLAAQRLALQARAFDRVTGVWQTTPEGGA